MALSSTVFLSPHFSPRKITSYPRLISLHNSFPARCNSTSDPNGCVSPSPSPPALFSSFDFRAYWSSMISQIEDDLDAAVQVAYPEKVFEAMRYSVLAGDAKRASPIMCIACCDLVGGDRSAANPTACALEMVHTASQIHDDLPCMDDAPLRRSHPSNHAVYGVELAILAGDALFARAIEHIVRLTPTSLVPPKTVLRVITQIARTVGSTGMAAGQLLDMLSSTGREQTDAITVLEKKFGELSECSALCGGLLGGASEEEVEALGKYGRAVGVLHEVVDDILKEKNSGVQSNGPSGKSKSNASVVRELGMGRTIDIVEQLKKNAYGEIKGFGDKYGDRVLPLYHFVNYAAERSFVAVDDRHRRQSSPV